MGKNRLSRNSVRSFPEGRSNQSVFIGADAKLIGWPCCVATVKADITCFARKSNPFPTSAPLLRRKFHISIGVCGKGVGRKGRKEWEKEKRRHGARLVPPSVLSRGREGNRSRRKSFREIARLTRHRFQFSSF